MRRSGPQVEFAIPRERYFDIATFIGLAARQQATMPFGNSRPDPVRLSELIELTRQFGQRLRITDVEVCYVLRTPFHEILGFDPSSL